MDRLTTTRTIGDGGHQRGAGLVDVLDRVLDKGLVIAGDIKVSLAEVELLTIRIRLIICSIDKAQEIGMDWWKHDVNLAPGRAGKQGENEQLRRQVRDLERRLEALTGRKPVPAFLAGAVPRVRSARGAGSRAVRNGREKRER